MQQLFLRQDSVRALNTCKLTVNC